MSQAAIDDLTAAGIEVDTKPVSVKAKSRDFFWYSPVLKDRLDHVTADFVATPSDEAQVVETLRICHRHGVPVTTRGAGTGNYGQAMPLAGGCVLHLAKLNRVVEVAPGRVVTQPGVLLKDVDAACIAHSGQELRMYSSTWATATIGGFVAGGSGGVGSVRWGALRDPGNIIRLRVVTMEAEPRIVDITGDDLHRVSHAYGTNGVITELEMPLAPAYDWIGAFVAFDDFDAALDYTVALGAADGLLLKLVTLFEAPIAHSYFQRVAPHVEDGTALVAVMVAPHAWAAFETLTGHHPGRVIHRSDDVTWDRDPGPVFEYGWNHTTLRALKVDPAMTYLQIAYGTDDPAAKVRATRAALSPECLQHIEVMRDGGKVALAGLTLVRFTTEARLDEIIDIHERLGGMSFNPHRYTLEEGGRQAVDDRQLAFKREADPKGLLNPGKMITWDDPDWGYERMYASPRLRPREAAE
ncbi:MAG: FAD-binding oxidoreductase [Paracoccaceae bacterium]